jgi:hypothetical protein
MRAGVLECGGLPPLSHFGAGKKREQAPALQSTAIVYRSAIQWMNHGHAFSQRSANADALSAYARAITLLHSLPLADHPSWANSLGAALMNHGQLLHRAHGLARADEAIADFTEAIANLSEIPSDVVPWARRNLAGSHINRANLLLDLGGSLRLTTVGAPLAGVPSSCRALPGTPASGASTSCFAKALADARFALALVAATERENPVDADLALKARRVLCDAIGQQLPLAAAAEQDALASEAADVVDDALALIRYWAAGEGCTVLVQTSSPRRNPRDPSAPAEGHDRFADPAASAFAHMAVRFFRFGTELYRRHQPHFLAEFIEENLAAALPSEAEELRVIAHLALEAALADGAVPALLLFDDPAAERALATRRELAAARERLDPPPAAMFQ